MCGRRRRFAAYEAPDVEGVNFLRALGFFAVSDSRVLWTIRTHPEFFVLLIFVIGLIWEEDFMLVLGTNLAKPDLLRKTEIIGILLFSRIKIV